MSEQFNFPVQPTEEIIAQGPQAIQHELAQQALDEKWVRENETEDPQALEMFQEEADRRYVELVAGSVDLASQPATASGAGQEQVQFPDPQTYQRMTPGDLAEHNKLVRDGAIDTRGH